MDDDGDSSGGGDGRSWRKNVDSRALIVLWDWRSAEEVEDVFIGRNYIWQPTSDERRVRGKSSSGWALYPFL